MGAPPNFESYRVTLHPIKNFAPTQIPKAGLDWKMEDYLHYSDNEPLNFADRFTLFDIGCGTGCVEFCLIDRKTGVVYPGTDFTQDFPHDYSGPFGLQFRRNSRLLVVYHAVGFEYPVHISSYVLDGTKMKLVQSEDIQAPIQPGNKNEPLRLQ